MKEKNDLLIVISSNISICFLFYLSSWTSCLCITENLKLYCNRNSVYFYYSKNYILQVMAKVQIFVNISFFSDVMFSKPRFLGFFPFQMCSVTEFTCHVVSSLRKLLLHSFHKAKGKGAIKFWICWLFWITKCGSVFFLIL